jgi:hypothetical protein
MRRSPRTQRPARFDPLSPPMMIKGSELKNITIALPGTFTTTPTAYALAAGISQGSAAIANRIGNVIEPFHICFKGTLVGGQVNGIADDPWSTCRMFFCWADPGTVFTSGNCTVAGIINPRTLPGFHHMIRDEVVTLGSPGKDSVGYMRAVKMITVSATLRSSQRIMFSGSGTSTEVGLTPWLVFVSDSAVAPAPGFGDGTASFYYQDK